MLSHHRLDRLDQFLCELLTALGDEACEVVALQMLPETFDGMEVRTVGRKINRFDMVPVEGLHFVPTGVVENEFAAASGHWWNLLCHRVEEDLENISVAMRNDQADELSSSWGNRTEHVLPNMSPEIILGNSFAPFGPFATRSGIAFETGFVSEEQVTTFVFDHLQQFSCKGFRLVLPHFDIRWLGNWSRYFQLG